MFRRSGVSARSGVRMFRPYPRFPASTASSDHPPGLQSAWFALSLLPDSLSLPHFGYCSAVASPVHQQSPCGQRALSAHPPLTGHAGCRSTAEARSRQVRRTHPHHFREGLRERGSGGTPPATPRKFRQIRFASEAVLWKDGWCDMSSWGGASGKAVSGRSAVRLVG